VAWDPGRWVLQAGYGHNDFLSTDSAQKDLDRSSEYFFARGGWRFAESTEAGLEASATLTSFRYSPRSDSQSFSVGVYANWQLTQNLQVAVRGGPQFYSFNNGSTATNSDLNNTYYAALNVNHKLTHYLSHQLSLMRGVTLGLNPGTDYVEQFSADYSFTLALTQHINVGGNITYENGSQPLLVPVHNGISAVSQTEDFDRAGFGANLSWSFTDHFSASVHYNFWDRSSSLAGRGYTQNTLGLQINYDF
jgi:hypothetical protein